MTTAAATPAERKEWVGREVELTTGQPPKVRTRRYRVVDVARFSPDGELKIQIGSVNAAGLGSIGLWMSAAEAVVVAS